VALLHCIAGFIKPLLKPSVGVGLDRMTTQEIVDLLQCLVSSQDFL